jgi:hypothetical protein
MVQDVGKSGDKTVFTHRAMGYFLADDGRKYIYSAGEAKTTSAEPREQAFWFSA